jgi:hypothetical protein
MSQTWRQDNDGFWAQSVTDWNGFANLLNIFRDGEWIYRGQSKDRPLTTGLERRLVLARQYAVVRAEIVAIEKRIHAWHRSCEESRRLEEIPGVGPIVATALMAEVGDWKEFTSGRSLAEHDTASAGAARFTVA